MPSEKYAALLAHKSSHDPGRMALIRDAAAGRGRRRVTTTVIWTFYSRNDDPAPTIESSMIIDNGIFIDDFMGSHWSVNDACAAVGRHHR
jgi:hypothetical protein